MFVKPLVKYNKSTKQRYNIYQLCESFRLDGRIRHRVIVGLGKLDDLPLEVQKKLLGKRIEELLTGQGNGLSLFKTNESVEKLAHYYLSKIKKKGRYDFGKVDSDWQTVDLSGSCRTGHQNEQGHLWQAQYAEPIYELIGGEIESYDLLQTYDPGTIVMAGQVGAIYTDDFYTGKTAVSFHQQKKGSVCYVGIDSSQGD
jgi:hypothetical protein